MPSPPIPPDELVRHAGFLRALGRKLLLDEDTIEDAAQDAMATGLQQGPRETTRARGWLAQVFHNAARQRRRSTTRTRVRERAASRAERVEPTIDAVARRDVMQRVADSVMALPEPYREVVLLRYYDGLPPRAIADRLGTPVTTIKSRLHRALGQLRVVLDASDRQGAASWRVALAPVADPHLWDGAAGLAVGGVMSKAKIAVVTAAVVGLAIGGFALLDIGDDIDEAAPDAYDPQVEVGMAEFDGRPAHPMEVSDPDAEVRDAIEKALAEMAEEEGERELGAPERDPTGGVAGNHGGTTSVLDRAARIASLQVENETVKTAIDTLQIMSGVSIVIDPRLDEKVTSTRLSMQLEDVELATALSYLATITGAEWHARENLVVFGRGP